MGTGSTSRRGRRGLAALAALLIGGVIAVPAGAGTAEVGQAQPEGPSAEAHGPVDRGAGDEAAPAPLAAAAVASNLSYTTVDACRVFDSRTAGGAFGHGDGFFMDLTWPCGLPDDGSVKAVMASVISVNASGTGYVRAAPYDPTASAPSATVLNFNGGLVSSNTVPLSLCDPATTVCDWELDLWIPAAATSNIVIDVVGYFS